MGAFPLLLLPTNEHQRIHPYWRQNLWLIHFFVHSFIIISRSQSLPATRRFHLSIENKMSSRTYNPSVSELNKAIAGYLAKDVSDNVQRSRNEIWGADVGLLARMTPCLTLPFPFSGVSRSTLVSPWCSLTPWFHLPPWQYHKAKDIHPHLKQDHPDWYLPERRVAKFTKRLKAGTPISDADEEMSVMSQRSGGSWGKLFSSKNLDKLV